MIAPDWIGCFLSGFVSLVASIADRKFDCPAFVCGIESLFLTSFSGNRVSVRVSVAR
jgi:hypothetical protein